MPLITWDLDNNLLDLSGLDTSFQDKLELPAPSEQTIRIGFYRQGSGDVRQYLDLGADPSIEFLIKPSTGNNRFDVAPVVASPTFTRTAVDDLGNYFYEGSLSLSAPAFLKALGIETGFVSEEFTITATDNTDGKLFSRYFDIYYSPTLYKRFWFDTSPTTQTAPSIGGANALVRVEIASDDTADTVAAAIDTAFAVIPTFALSTTTNVVSVEYYTGAVGQHDPQNSGVAITVTTAGSAPGDRTDVTSASYTSQLVYLDGASPQLSPLFTLQLNNSLYRDGQTFPAGTTASYFEVKATDQTRGSTTTLANDSALIVALKAGTYQFDGTVVFSNDTGGTTPGLKHKLNYTGTYSVGAGVISYGENGTTTTAGSYPNSTDADIFAPTFTSTARNYMTQFSGVLVTSTDGNFSFQWAQNISSTTVTRVKAGSVITFKKLA